MKKDPTTDASFKIIQLSDRVRMSLYMDDDITPLFDEYEEFEKRYKKNSKSSMNLSSIEHM
jgi:lysyl-tRNA synthetase class I